MANVLFLVHRMPWPPDKGDKARSHHMLRQFAEKHRVFLGTFVDDPADTQHEPAVRALCADAHFVPLHRQRARLASLRGLLQGQPLTLPYYHDSGLADWVHHTLANHTIDAAVVFSSCMAQYSSAVAPAKVLVDMVDVDSAKWTEYAHRHRWPLSWVYRREGRRLLAWERAVAGSANHTFFATEKEAQFFSRLAPECAGRVSGMNSGVDAEFFEPRADRPSPFRADEQALVFTGVMDYWPNVDAVLWFAKDVLPALRNRYPRLRFYVVGRNPTPAVLALQSDAVTVTSAVPDVRPYIQHGQVVVAPLRLARGIQNKVLEAMAMGRPVVAAQSCVQALDVKPGQEIIAAQDGTDYVTAISSLLDDTQAASTLGAAARVRVMQSYGWRAQIGLIEARLDSVLAARQQPQAQRPSAAAPCLP